MIKIGIMGAMAQEVAHLKKSMIIASEEIIASRIYYSGTLIDAEIVLVFSHWGKVAAASTATTLINKFNVDAIIFTGVAGAVSEKLNIGDIVIGAGVYQHDMDARPFFEQFQIPLTNNIIFKLDPNGIDKADHTASIDCLSFMNEIAGEYSAGIVQRMLQN